MGIIYYFGADGPTINVESRKDVYEALDAMHTQVMDNLPDDLQLLNWLEATMHNLIDDLDVDPNE